MQKQLVIKKWEKNQKNWKKGVDFGKGLFYTVNHRPMRCGWKKADEVSEVIRNRR